MKNFLRKVIIFALFILIWCIPLTKQYNITNILIFILCYTASVMSLVFIKHKYISLLTGFAFVLILVLSRNEFLFLIFAPLIITFKYIQLFKYKNDADKKNSIMMFFTVAVVSVIVSTTLFIYKSRYHYWGDIKNFITKYEMSQLLIWVMLIVFSILSATCLSKKVPWQQLAFDSEFCEEDLKELRSLHIANLICFIETIVYFYLIDGQTSNYTERVIFYPCFFFLCLMVHYNDPVFFYFIEKTENIFKKMTEK